MKSTTHLLFLILFATTQAQPNWQCGTTSVGCIGAHSTGCIHHRYRSIGKFYCSERKGPSSDHCIQYSQLGGTLDSCDFCKTGHSPDVSSPAGYPCHKTSVTIENCLSYEYYSDTKITQCKICDGGYPDHLTRSCLPFSKVENPIENCAEGSGVYDPDKMNLDCFRCKKGYIAKADHSEPDHWSKCVMVEKSQKGARAIDIVGSLECDVMNGYYAVNDYQCFKKSSD